MSELSRLEQIERRADYLIERLDKANDEKNDLLEVMKTLYDILGGAYSVRNQEKSLEILEETLNRYDED
jgi:transposase-like protein